MKMNLGPYDRILRIILGGGAVIAGLIFWSWSGLFGLIPLVTAFFGYCPLYVPLHLNTCPPNAKRPSPPTPPAHAH